jgi:hypothetical protein
LKRENDVDVAEHSQQVMSYKQLPISFLRDFSKFLSIKYNKNENAINNNEQKEFELTFQLGIIQAKRNLFSKQSSLLHKGKKPRTDVWKKLGFICYEFLKCNTYPLIPSYALSNILNSALGNKDPRVIKDYRKTVLENCNFDENVIDNCKDSRLGEIDVSFFVSQIPKQYITSSTSSSFIEGNLENEL